MNNKTNKRTYRFPFLLETRFVISHLLCILLLRTNQFSQHLKKSILQSIITRVQCIQKHYQQQQSFKTKKETERITNHK